MAAIEAIKFIKELKRKSALCNHKTSIFVDQIHTQKIVCLTQVFDFKFLIQKMLDVLNFRIVVTTYQYVINVHSNDSDETFSNFRKK